jgi:hypothetical protein
MGMKPIASRSVGWIISPLLIESLPTEDAIRISCTSKDSIWARLPDGLTFSQFLDQYNRCTDAIYFID